MKWTEVVINAEGRGTDALCAELAGFGIEGVITEDEDEFKEFLENNRQLWDYVDDELEKKYKGLSRVRFYLPDNEEGKVLLDRVRKRFGDSPDVFPADDADWINNWREFFKPAKTGEKLLIVPDKDETPVTDRIILRIDPGLLFGTGNHATTRMCLIAAEKYATPGSRALDVGCGSGILGIAARLFGCSEITGCDIDPAAISVATRNAGLNGLADENFRVYTGNILTDATLREALGTGYKLIFANITADVIIPLCGIIRQFAGKDAVFVCSGIIEGRNSEVSGALRAAGFCISEHSRSDDWHCFVCAL